MITIMISDEAWDKLNKMKTRGESFLQVVDKLLKVKSVEEGSD